MSRFKTTLDTVKRNLIVIDTETDAKLTITQILSKEFVEKLLEGDDEDGLVVFANDLNGDLLNATLSLELFGDSTITFNDRHWPRLSGGVFLRTCILNNPQINNSSLSKVIAPKSKAFHATHSTIEEFEWEHQEKFLASHCFINSKYNAVIERSSPERNEWFMNERVENEVW